MTSKDASNPQPQPDAQTQPTDESSVGFAPTPEEETGFGWTSYAERINGRFAMIGFMALLILELITHQSFFEWLGL